MRFSSSFKVGILTLAALLILVFSILWIKGRALSTGERLTIEFKDVNGMRPGSAVQLMGFRVGQVEEITPVINNENSFVRVKFVITEPDITIPQASAISIQQSGIIGEQFLEITPPKIKFIYMPIGKKSQFLHANDKVEMKLSDKYYDVGNVKKIEIVETKTLPLTVQEEIKTEFAYKVGYVITLPGLVLPDRIEGKIKTERNIHKLRLTPRNQLALAYPKTNSKYTVIEPLRLSDFLDLQYRAASSMTEMNEKINTILSDDVITEIKDIVQNINDLTLKAGNTLDKTQLLIDSSKEDLDKLMVTTDSVSQKVIILTDNLNNIVGDEEFKDTLISTTKSIDRLSQNMNELLEDPKTKQTIQNLQAASKNIAEISEFVNTMTKDEKLKAEINSTMKNLNTALEELTITLTNVNNLTTEQKSNIESTLDNACETSKNLRKFSEKLNKRFLLFRLMF